MAVANTPQRSIRLTGRDATRLENTAGQTGEVFFDSTNNSLRIFDGRTTGGYLLGRGLSLEETQDLIAAMFTAGVSHVGVTAQYIDSSGKIRLTGFSGSYADLTNKPVLFSGSYADLTNKPTLFDGNYNSLTNRPTLFSGSYNDLLDKPTIPGQVNLTGYATETYVGTQISNLIGTAGAALNTLGELSDALADDASFASTVTTALSAKAPLADPTFTGTVSGITATMVGLSNVTNESKATMFTNPTFTGTVSGVTKTHVGLSNVTNVAQEPAITAGTTAQYWRGDKSFQTLNATAVGLGNVTNESKGTMFTNPSFSGGTVFMNSSNVQLINDYKLYWGTSNTTFLSGNSTPAGSESIYLEVAGVRKLTITQGGIAFSDTVSGINATMVGLSNVTNESKATMFTSPRFTGTTTLQQSVEVSTPIVGAGGGGDVLHNFSLSSVWYHYGINGDFTADFTNVPTTTDRTIVCTLILSQGSIARLPNTVKIGGSTQTLKWQGGVQPTPAANKVEIVSFALIRSLNAWTVIGSLSSYG